MTAADLALIAGGGLLVVVAGIDLFLTVFNYDGFTFVSGRYQRLCWRLVLTATAALPSRGREAARSLGSASLLPATVALWLAAQITGFALIYEAGIRDHGFEVAHHLLPGLGSAYYLSGGAESSLSFGDLIPRAGLFQAAADIQTILGLATFTLALGYVVTTFGVLGDLNALHNLVHRHARHSGRPTSILARHYRGGEATELPELLQTLSDRLESYEEGLRRYPVVYYFHTRRPARSVPDIFANLGELLADIRWGLPPEDPMAADPWLAALLEQYATTIGRLQRSFVGPEHFQPDVPRDPPVFAAGYRDCAGDNAVVAYRQLQNRTRAATGQPAPPDADLAATYQRYVEWLPFDQRQRCILTRVARHLGYEPPRPASPICTP